MSTSGVYAGMAVNDEMAHWQYDHRVSRDATTASPSARHPDRRPPARTARSASTTSEAAARRILMPHARARHSILVDAAPAEVLTTSPANSWPE
jgi:hypothetical protein